MILTSKQKLSILPVKCGQTQGTCFVTSGGVIITAHHVVSDFFRNGIKPIIEFADRKYECDNAELLKKGIDIVILYCKKLLMDMTQVEGLVLLPTPPAKMIDQQHTIVGYPQEIGLGSNLIEITVEPKATLSQKRDYDVVTMRSDNFSFTRYDGFSGSPVVNKLGYVVGAAVVEVSNKIAFVSIDSIRTLLRRNRIEFEKRWQLFNPSETGIYKCNNLLKTALAEAGSRYQELVHVDNPKFKETVKNFWSYRRLEHRSDVLAKIVTSFTNIGGNSAKDNYDELIKELKSASTNSKFIQYYHDIAIWRKTAESTLDHYRASTAKVMLVIGKAGTGKTHLSCNLAKTLIEKEEHNAYILFGSMFNEQKTAVERFYELLGMNKDALRVLDEECKHKKQFAVFIIDALNEGAGDSYWRDNLPKLVEELKPYDNLKLFITIRSPFANKILSRCNDKDWLKFELTGFSTAKEKVAEGIFFEKFKVERIHTKVFKREFKNPLFLYIFCQAYGEMSDEDKKRISHVRLYELYLKARNIRVSEIAEEDAQRNVTLQLMLRLALISVFDFESNVISRNISRKEADTLCPFRTWRNNLLRAMLDENLLMPVAGDKGENDLLMFEYENMADFLKAKQLMRSKLTDGQIFQLLIRTDNYYRTNSRKSRAKFDNMVGALLAIWDRKTPILPKVVPKIENIASSISIAKNYTAESNYKELIKWLTSEENRSSFTRVMYAILDMSQEWLMEWHTQLCIQSISDRDSTWTVDVNRFFDNSSCYDRIVDIISRDKNSERCSMFIVWLLTTSYPEAHAFLTMQLRKLFCRETSLIETVLAKFGRVNDNYVHYGILRAIYGCLLLDRNKKLVAETTRNIISVYYKDGNLKSDIVIRTLVLKIVSFNESLNKVSIDGLELPPYNAPIPRTISKQTRYDENYFGENKAGLLTYHTLDEKSDFHKYILRSNWYVDNELFVKLEEDGTVTKIPISVIASMIARGLHDKFHFTHSIATFDTELGWSGNRMENVKERIGKKYTWIALNEVYAGLMDNYEVKDPDHKYNPNYSEYADIRYPWYADILKRIDANMDDDILLNEKCPIKFVDEDKCGLEPLLSLRDQNGQEWIQIVCFDHRTTLEMDFEYNTVTYSNGCFCHAEEVQETDKWAAKTDFTGRWMPESEEHYEYLWNEYPWFDMAVRNTNSSWRNKNNSPNILVAYEGQLQEETIGVRGIVNSNVAYAPNVDFMKEFNLYTAERGIVRAKDDNSIVAINRCPYYDTNTGLYIRKDFLLKYLKKNNLVLYNFVLCTKNSTRGDAKFGDFSGCWKFDALGKWKEIQKIHEIPLH